MRGAGDAAVALLAERQHGHVHRDQLGAAGIGRHAIAGRVRAGRLHAALPGVYLVGRPRTDVVGRMMAAALHFRGDRLVTGRAAAQLWGLLDTTQLLTTTDPVAVLLVGRNAAAPALVCVHRTGAVTRQDIRWRDGVPVTSPARTCLALAAELDELELEAALGIALGRSLVRRAQLADVVSRNPYAKGVARLRRLLGQDDPMRDTRSLYERRLLRLLTAAGLPLPLTNVMLGDELVDGWWPDLKLVLEFDGWRYHGSRDRFERDRLRDQVLATAGHQVLRVTRRQIDQAPYALVARIASIITAVRLGR